MMKKNLNWFVLLTLAAMALGTVFSLVVPREELHMATNRWHSSFQDLLFRAWTLLGDGWILLVVIVLASLVRIRVSLALFAAFAISGMAVQLLKRLVFRSTARPVKYFELESVGYDLYIVPGVDLHHWQSFPSGHTAAAFGVFFGLSLVLRSWSLQVVLFLLAAGVAWSRIYLSQHFLMDVVAGAAVGLAGGYLGYRWIYRYNRIWLDRSLYQLLKR